MKQMAREKDKNQVSSKVCFLKTQWKPHKRMPFNGGFMLWYDAI